MPRNGFRGKETSFSPYKFEKKLITPYVGNISFLFFVPESFGQKGFRKSNRRG